MPSQQLSPDPLEDWGAVGGPSQKTNTIRTIILNTSVSLNNVINIISRAYRHYTVALYIDLFLTEYYMNTYSHKI